MALAGIEGCFLSGRCQKMVVRKQHSQLGMQFQMVQMVEFKMQHIHVEGANRKTSDKDGFSSKAY